jgi:hypothetical protein
MKRWLRIEDLLGCLPELGTDGRRITQVVLHHTWRPSSPSRR